MSESRDVNESEMESSGNANLESNNSMGGSHAGDWAGDESKESSATGFQDLYGESTDNDWTRQVREMMQARFGCSLEDILNRVQQRRHRNVHCDPPLSPALTPTPACSPNSGEVRTPERDADVVDCTCEDDPSQSHDLAKKE